MEPAARRTWDEFFRRHEDSFSELSGEAGKRVFRFVPKDVKHLVGVQTEVKGIGYLLDRMALQSLGDVRPPVVEQVEPARPFLGFPNKPSHRAPDRDYFALLYGPVNSPAERHQQCERFTEREDEFVDKWGILPHSPAPPSPPWEVFFWDEVARVPGPALALLKELLEALRNVTEQKDELLVEKFPDAMDRFSKQVAELDQASAAWQRDTKLFVPIRPTTTMEDFKQCWPVVVEAQRLAYGSKKRPGRTDYATLLRVYDLRMEGQEPTQIGKQLGLSPGRVGKLLRQVAKDIYGKKAAEFLRSVRYRRPQTRKPGRQVMEETVSDGDSREDLLDRASVDVNIPRAKLEAAESDPSVLTDRERGRFERFLRDSIRERERFRQFLQDSSRKRAKVI